ncbi:MAG: dienelactone hydrolase family protein [Bacteroidota bacterium]|nr:dienelactone hydrolase family protein [Bacteroidota bacterium]MDP4253911.1 dienelactone hydrolase family protein [Bacteroidota bacterium]MDP4257274.1 dienelactone hydrolase family protein [Bacteroidota bacterium]
MACNNEPKQEAQSPSGSDSAVYKEEMVTYNGDNATLNGYVVYDANNKNRRPAVLVVPEWWGLTDYPKMRAMKLAKLGYVAMAIDIYGGGKIADNPDSAKAFATPFYMNPQSAKARIDAAIAKIKTYPVVDTANIGAIGYCFGGGMLLNTVRLGDELKGVVSFHGSLIGTPARKDLLKTRILVCHGNADQFVTQKDVAAFKHQMDSIGANYQFVGYDSATHAFTNPDATAMGQKFHMPIAYNAKADTASWEAMQSFFNGLFK